MSVDTPISGLPDASLPLQGSEYVMLLQSGVTCKARLNTMVVLASYSKSSLPSASVPGTLIYVVDDVGGAVPAFADGSVFRRVTDRAVIS